MLGKRTMDFKVTYLDAGLTSAYFNEGETPNSNGSSTGNSVTPSGGGGAEPELETPPQKCQNVTKPIYETSSVLVVQNVPKTTTIHQFRLRIFTLRPLTIRQRLPQPQLYPTPRCTPPRPRRPPRTRRTTRFTCSRISPHLHIRPYIQ